MQDSITVSVSWNDRKESARECAHRAAQIFACMAQVDPSLQQWFRRGRSRRHALSRNVATDEDSLEKLFRSGVHRRDFPPREIIAELGFGISVWNGGSDEESISFRYDGGSYDSPRNTFGWNECVLELPRGGAAGQRLNHLEPVLTLLQGMIQATEPLWGLVRTDKHVTLQIAREDKMDIRPTDTLDVGWVMYFAYACEEIAATFARALPHLPPPRRTPDGGVLVLATTERFDADRPEHIEAADAIERVLGDAGLLRLR